MQAPTRVLLTNHAIRRVAERNIATEWLERAIRNPDWETKDLDPDFRDTDGKLVGIEVLGVQNRVRGGDARSYLDGLVAGLKLLPTRTAAE